MSIISPNYSGASQGIITALANLAGTGSNIATASTYIDNTGNGSVLLPGVITNTNGSPTVTVTALSGTNTVTNGSLLVTNSGTNFTQALGGTVIQFSSQPGVYYTVAEFLSTSTLFLTMPYTGGTSSSATIYQSGAMSFNTALYTGQTVQFGNQLGTSYTILSIASAVSLTLSANYTGTGSAATTISSLGNQFEDILVQARITVSATPAAPALVNFYATGSNDGFTYGEYANGQNGPVTLTSPPNARLIGSLNTGTTAAPTTNIGGSTVILTNGSTIVNTNTTSIANLAVGQTITFSTGQVGVPYTITAIYGSTSSTSTLAAAGGLTNNSATVTGSASTFTTSYVPGQVVTFSGGTPTASGSYTILSIQSNTQLTLATPYTGSTTTVSATLTGNPTFTLNTPYTGSATSTGVITVYVNKFSSPMSVAAAFGGTLPDHIVIITENRTGQTLYNTAITPTIALIPGASSLTASASLANFLTAGQMISFSAQLGVMYTVSSVSTTTLVLTSNYTGVGAATASLYVEGPPFSHTWQGVKRQLV